MKNFIFDTFNGQNTEGRLHLFLMLPRRIKITFYSIMVRKTRKRRRGGFLGFGRGGTFSDRCRNLNDAEGVACTDKHHLKQLLNCIKTAKQCLERAPTIAIEEPRVGGGYVKTTVDINDVVSLLGKKEREVVLLGYKVQGRIDAARDVKKKKREADERKRKQMERLKTASARPAKTSSSWWGGRKRRRTRTSPPARQSYGHRRTPRSSSPLRRPSSPPRRPPSPPRRTRRRRSRKRRR